TLNHNWNRKSFGDFDFDFGDLFDIEGSLPKSLELEYPDSNQHGVSDYTSPQNSIDRLGSGNLQANKKRLPSDSATEKLAEHGAFPANKKIRSSDVLPGHLSSSGTNDQVHQAFDLVHQGQAEFHPTINLQESFAQSTQTDYTLNKFLESIMEVEQVLHNTQGYAEKYNNPFSEAESWLSNFPSSFHDFETGPNQHQVHHTQGNIETYNVPISEAESWLSNFHSPFHDSNTLLNQRPEYSTQLNVKNNEPLSRAESWLSNFPSPFHDSDTLPNQRSEFHTPVNAKIDDEPYSDAESWLSNFPSPFHDSDTLLNQRPVYSTEVNDENNEFRAESWLSNSPTLFHESHNLPNQCPKSHTQVNAKSNNGPIAEAETWLSNIPSPVHDFDTLLNQPSNYQAHPTNYPAHTALPTTMIEIPGSGAGVIQPGSFFSSAPISPAENQIATAENTPIYLPSIFLLNSLTTANQPPNSLENGDMPKVVKENYFATPIGGSIDYKLNLYYTIGLNNPLLSKEIKKILSVPGFSYNLFQASMKSFVKLKQVLNEKHKDLFPIKLESLISKEDFRHFQVGTFRLKSEVSVNEIIGFVQKALKQNGLQEKITLDNYIASIFDKAGLENLGNHSQFENPTDLATEELEVESNDAFKGIIALHKHLFFSERFSLKPIVRISIEERLTKKVLNEISVQLGLKRLKSLGLENKLNFLEGLRKKFDGMMKKTNKEEIDWCESAVRIVSAVSNRIILINRIFSPFDEVRIKSLKENLTNFIESTKVFFSDFYEFLTDPEHKFKGQINLLDQDELKNSITNYKKSKTFMFEHFSSTKIFLNWVTSNFSKQDLAQRKKFKKSKLVNNFLTNIILIDFVETYKYPLEDHLWL
ncbi:hypothetical protein PPACK8108_LOCUS25384, partial [Phakopsora pachyrhizi]